ncbi:hypothetical protein ACOMHN_034282 [Nucella lapillus]
MPPLSDTPPPHRSSSAEKEAVIQSEITLMLQKGAIQELHDPGPGFYSRLFVVPKPNGSWRPILDLSPLNKFIRDMKFRMESTSSIRESIRSGDWAASIDLKDAYFHINIAQAHRKYLRFVWRGRTFQFKALPFGLSLAPFVFTKVCTEVASLARTRAIRLRCYLDDWVILAETQELCQMHVLHLRNLCLCLGFLLNEEKCDLTPSQTFNFLGMKFNTTTMLVSPAPKRVLRLHELLSGLYRQNSTPVRSLYSLLGTMESLSNLVPLGRSRKRPFQRALRSRWSQARDGWDVHITLGLWLQESTRDWTNSSILQEKVPIAPPLQDLSLYTDASNCGWGAHMGPLHAQGLWNPDQANWHINALEMEAVCLALVTFQDQVLNKSIRLFTDNTTVACYINKQGGARSSTLSLMAESLLQWCYHRNITLQASHIAGKLNILADALSRSKAVLSTEWTLNSQLLDVVWTTWYRPMVDLFATRFNHQLPTFVSPVPDPLAWATDALSIPWRGILGPAISDVVPSDPTHPPTGSPPSTSIGHLPPQPFPPSAPRMETGKNRRPLTRQRPSRASSVQSAWEREGVDPSIRHLFSLSRWKGTESLYGSRWQKWVRWARENKFDPFSPSRTHLVNFLGHLSTSRSLSSSSVRGYRAAICTTLRQIGGPDFSEDPLLRDLLRGILAAKAASPRRVPMWDLFLVLNSLLVPPYEPLVSIQMELLSFKTVFLVALASGRRRSEIHALSGLSQDVGFHPDGSVSLQFLPEFLAKNQTPGSPSPAIIIRPLSTIVDKSEPDITLCPVRAVKYYWDRTRSLRTTQRRFFISLRAGRSKDISAATISRWISQTIRSAYTQAHLDVSSVQPRAHEVRSIATSAAFQYSLSLRDVLEAAYWRSENPFINFYLRDFRTKRADGTKGISFVAASVPVTFPRPARSGH